VNLMTKEQYSGVAAIAPVVLQPGEVVPLVSVVIATYNMGTYVVQAVNSVLEQQGIDLEVVVVDDGSTDDTQAALAQFSENPYVRVIVQPNRGQPCAKNAGLRASRGQFIAFCDADDFWLPNKLTLQLPLFAQNPQVGVVYSPVLILHTDGSLSEETGRDFYRHDVLEELFLRNIVPFGTAVVRRDCFERLGGFDHSIPMGIDWDLWLRIAVEWDFDFVNQPTYIYRIWDGQMSANWRKRYECALRIMANFLERHPGRLSDQVIATCYADTYTNLALEQVRHVGIGAALTAIRKALACRVDYWPTWRLLLTLPWIRYQRSIR
jgi:glycosyltransferase involved in cell wall biosynthesis